MTLTKDWQDYMALGPTVEPTVDETPAPTKAAHMPSDLVVGQYLQLIALHIAAAIAVMYTAGYTLGAAVHTLNKQLAEYNQLTTADKLELLMLQLQDYLQGAVTKAQALYQ